MTPPRHALVSGLIAVGCGMAWDSVPAGLAAFAGGTAIDVDHLLDFRWNRAGRFTPKRFLGMCNQFRLKRFYLLLHSFEWLLPFLVWGLGWSDSPLVWSFTLGLGFHVVMDVMGNGLRWPANFLAYRLVNRFDARRLVMELPPTALSYWGSYDDYLRGRPRRRRGPGRGTR